MLTTLDDGKQAHPGDVVRDVLYMFSTDYGLVIIAGAQSTVIFRNGWMKEHWIPPITAKSFRTTLYANN